MAPPDMPSIWQHADSSGMGTDEPASRGTRDTGAPVPYGVGFDTTRDRPEGFFITPDTAPPGLSVKRSRWVVPLLLVLFAACSAGVNRWILPMTHVYGRVLRGLAHVPPGTFGKQASVAVRPLMLLLMFLFALLLSGPPLRRLRLLLTTVTVFAVAVLTTDLALIRLSLRAGAGPFGALGNTVAGLDGILALAAGIFTTAALPPGVVVRTELKRPARNIVLLTGAAAVALVAVWQIRRHWAHLLAVAAKIPLLGGIASAFVLFFGVFPGVLFVLDLIRRRRRRPSEVRLSSVGIVVPARNEAGLIGDCVRAIDEAVADYPAVCTVYVVENGSDDGTGAEARAAIEAARYVRGVLLRCEPKGKAYALNYGLRHVREDIVLRIDADTLVTRSVLFGLVRHFCDPSVGGASGMPLPRVQSSWICRMRALEVYYQVGFKRTGYNAVDAIGVLPGALVAYRRDTLLKLNGFAEGVNGEDADMTVRVGRLGYRIISDPSVRAYTEMPSTFAYLREQRMRWARGTYHMLARNKSGIVMMQGLRCVWMLPWAGFVMFRRLMMLPFAAAGVLLVAVNHSQLPLQEISAGGAILLGVQFIQMGLCMLLIGDPRLIASIPGYLVFRLIVSFFALETLLGLAFTSRPRHSSHRSRPAGLARRKKMLAHDNRRAFSGAAPAARPPTKGTPHANSHPGWRWVPGLADRDVPVRLRSRGSRSR
jgi:cellulose synthase/poly-beta-1,6-N-acetylglucosamine synthase-like glycosyltransferase